MNPNSNPMCYPIGARLDQCCILALDTLYHHLFSTPGHNTHTINQLKHDLVLWSTHHSFEELPDALEYYLADPNSDLEGNLAHLDTIYIKTQVFRLLRYYSPAPRDIARSDWANQNITHNMTSSKT